MEMWAKCLPRVRARCLFHGFSDNLWSIPRGIYDANDACISSTLIVHSAPNRPVFSFSLDSSCRVTFTEFLSCDSWKFQWGF